MHIYIYTYIHIYIYIYLYIYLSMFVNNTTRFTNGGVPIPHYLGRNPPNYIIH